MDKLIENKATGTSKIVQHWGFIPLGNIIVNKVDTNACVGQVYYSNTNLIFGGAVKVKDWVFVTEKLKDEARQKFYSSLDKNAWAIAAFNGDTHYTFTGFIGTDDEALGSILLTYVTENFFPILYPEITKKSIQDTLEVHPLY